MKPKIDKYLKVSDLKNKSSKDIKSEISYLKITSAVIVGLLIFAYGLSFFRDIEYCVCFNIYRFSRDKFI